MGYNQQRLGRNVGVLRKKRKLRASELSDFVGISTSFLHLIERGERGLSLEKASRISEILGVSLDDLINNEYENDEGRFVVNEVSESDDKGQLYAYLYDLKDEELDFLVKITGCVRTYVHNKSKDTDISY